MPHSLTAVVPRLHAPRGGLASWSAAKVGFVSWSAAKGGTVLLWIVLGLLATGCANSRGGGVRPQV